MDNYVRAMAQPFVYPFPESENYKIPQGSIAEIFNGGIVFDNWGTLTPCLPINALLFQSQEIFRNLLQSSILYDDLILLDNALLSSIQVFLVTNDSIGKLHDVINLFTKETHQVPVPNLNKEEPTSPDYLGCYVPETGAIYIMVDKLFDNPLILQKVLLHEFIHLLFDVIRRNIRNHEKASQKEEKYDNFLAIHCYSNISINGFEKNYIVKKIRDFIDSQPSAYKAANAMFDTFHDWFSARTELISFLKPNYKSK